LIECSKGADFCVAKVRSLPCQFSLGADANTRRGRP
jgi:hypothetical protein